DRADRSERAVRRVDGGRRQRAEQRGVPVVGGARRLGGAAFAVGGRSFGGVLVSGGHRLRERADGVAGLTQQPGVEQSAGGSSAGVLRAGLGGGRRRRGQRGETEPGEDAAGAEEQHAGGECGGQATTGPPASGVSPPAARRGTAP